MHSGALAPGHARGLRIGRGRLAQLVEHLVYTERVGGSSPSPPTTVTDDHGTADHFARNTSLRGNFSNTEASCEKFVARISLGFPAIHWDTSIVW